MGSSFKKRRHSSTEGGANESKEERRERKRLKKESKKAKKHGSGSSSSSAHDNEITPLFSKRTIRLSVSILPYHLGNSSVKGSKNKAVEDFIRQAYLLKYSTALKGILLAFSDLEFENGGYGGIVQELPHIHYTVTCTALLFTPSPGLYMEGVVMSSSGKNSMGDRNSIINETDGGRHFHSHLSVIAYKYFNASISAKELRKSGLEFDTYSEQWYRLRQDEEGNQVKQPLASGTKIRFQIDQVHEYGGFVSMDGSNPLVIE